MTQRRRGSKRVKVSWESSVDRQDGRFVHLYVPYEGKMWLPSEKFQEGDKVRVTVELLARTRKG